MKKLIDFLVNYHFPPIWLKKNLLGILAVILFIYLAFFSHHKCNPEYDDCSPNPYGSRW